MTAIRLTALALTVCLALGSAWAQAERSAGLEFSFSGLKTALRRHIETLGHVPGNDEVADIAAAFREAVVDVLVARSLAAAKATHVPLDVKSR